ncbi:RHS repeat-associated core domain-containing protein [Thermopirellula anaerolimosa]
MVAWTLTDHLNTVRDIAKFDPQTGATTVVNHLVYDAFGNVTSESNPAVDSLFLFTARPFDGDTGLQNNLNRWYDPAVGRWLSEDPIGFAGGDNNLYRYVENAVLLRRDPKGLEFQSSGVKYCTGFIKGHYIWGHVPSHWFITIDGKGWGFFEQRLHSVGQGAVRDDDLQIYPEAAPAGVAEGQSYSVCQDVTVADECYDKSAFQQGVRQFIRDVEKAPGRYIVGVRDCRWFARSAIVAGLLKGRRNDLSLWECIKCSFVYQADLERWGAIRPNRRAD